MGVTAVLSVNMLTVIMLLTVSSLSGVLAGCPEEAALFITTPKMMDALSGSCLQIPCNFSVIKKKEEFDITRQIFGIWYKEKTDPSNVVFNSDGTVNTFPMNITGNLKMKSCTTLIYNLQTTYTGLYYFRIMNSPYRATAICDPLHITVKDSPLSPKLEIPADLKEKESVTITCSAFTPCPHSPPKLTWNLKQDSLNNMEENTDGTFTTKIQEQITLTDKHDGDNITCSASYKTHHKTLSVSYPPKNTLASISPSGSVSAGVHVNLSCSSRAKPPVSSFTWFRINTDETMKVSEGEFYSFNATKGGDYYCEAKNELGHQTSSRIHLNIGENSDYAHLWGSALGILVVVVCLAVCIWWLKSKRQTPQQNQSQRDGHVVALHQPPTETEETIHYGEIDFSVRRPERLSVSVQDSGQQQETLYAQVKVSKPASNRAQPVDSSDDIYAQVKKK